MDERGKMEVSVEEKRADSPNSGSSFSSFMSTADCSLNEIMRIKDLGKQIILFR